ncbi:MAG: hypothetical protein ACUVWX_12365, partial [Kiritimatiellia bacterium]
EAMRSANWPSYPARIVYDERNDLVLRAPAYDGEWAARHNKDTTWVYDPVRNRWEGRPTLAYDSDQDTVLCLHDGRTYVYTVKLNVWKKLDVDPPGKAAECMVYDTRHKVFLATHNMEEHMWAFRYRGGGD